jgi:hypothetical protein
MSAIGQRERATQNRLIALFRDELGYRYLGDWTDREGNSNIHLKAWILASPWRAGTFLVFFGGSHCPRVPVHGK